MKKVILILIIIVVIVFAYIVIISNNKNQTHIADYDYLDNLAMDNPLNINIIKEYPIDFSVYAIEVEDLDNDNKKEIIYKGRDKIFILNNNWEKQAECFAGSSVNGMEYILIDDIDEDDFKEIITTGGQDSILLQLRNKYSYGYSAQVEGGYASIKLNSWDGKINPQFFKDLEKEIKISEYKSDNEIILTNQEYVKASSENYSLKILDYKCNLISEYFISNYRQGTEMIYAKNVDKDLEKEIFIDLSHHYSEGINYIIDNNQLLKIKKGEIYNEISSEIDKIKYPINKEKIVNYRIGERIFLEDLDNGGSNEIISFVGEPVSYVGNTKIFILNFFNGQLLWKYTYPTEIFSETVADINNDGLKEIIVAGHTNDLITVFGISNN